MKKSLISILILNQLILGPAYALTKSALDLVTLETKSNAVSERNNNIVDIPHYEIPLEMVDVDFSERLSPQIRRHLVFEKEGKKYVRWVLNPEDTKWYLQVEAYFKEKGIELTKKYYFQGYQTASRSYIVEDPKKQIQFSVKSSTNNTGGNWADKKQPVGEAIDSRMNADFLAEVQGKLKFDHIVIMDEPAIMKIGALDQAVVLRDLADLNKTSSGKIYVPGFSVLHEKTGAEIALKNGSKDPYSFWTEHYIKAVGRALGEFAARTGMQFDSPHSQNFLVELDSNYKPTGRIVFRDLADLYIYRDFFQGMNSEWSSYFAKFSQKENILSHIAAGFGPLHGNNPPSWVSYEGYLDWKNDFLKEFESTFSRVSGLPLASFKLTEGRVNGRYFGNSYKIGKEETEEQRNFWENIKKFKTPRGVLNCSQLF